MRVDPGVPGADGAPLTLKLPDAFPDGEGLLLPADIQAQATEEGNTHDSVHQECSTLIREDNTQRSNYWLP